MQYAPSIYECISKKLILISHIVILVVCNIIPNLPIVLRSFDTTQELIRAEEGTSIANHYIVTLKDEGESTEFVQGKAESITDEIQGQLTQVYTSVMQGFAVSLSDEALNNILKYDRVTSVEEDAVVQLNAFGSWGLDRIGEIDLPLYQSGIPTIGNAGAGVTAYVIDTGILASHDEFEGRAVQ